MDSNEEKRHFPTQGELARRRRIYTIALTISVLAAIGSLTNLAWSVEPDSTFIPGGPWLVPLGPSRFGVQFITWGWDFSTVLFGILDGNGNWVSWPTPITPRSSFRVLPWDALTVADAAGRVHVAWTRFDTEQFVQTFHYLQLDPNGRIRVQTGPLGEATVDYQSFKLPVSPRFLVTDQEVQMFWQGNGTYLRTDLDFIGKVTSPPTAVPFVDPRAFPPRVEVEGGNRYDSRASAVSEGGFTYLLWQRLAFRGFGRAINQEYDVVWRRVGPDGRAEKAIYSTFDWWWTTRSLVVPSFVIFLAGIVAAPIFATMRTKWSLLRGTLRRQRRTWWLWGHPARAESQRRFLSWRRPPLRPS